MRTREPRGIMENNFNNLDFAIEKKVGEVGGSLSVNREEKTHFADRLKILLVEDEPLVQQVHLMMLQELNCDVTLAENGQRALEHTATNKYDVIFMDIELPDINGIDVTREIRHSSAPETGKCRIIALTAYIDSTVKNDCVRAGMDCVESKPVCIERLGELICSDIDQPIAKKGFNA